jgi:hypothetical protein
MGWYDSWDLNDNRTSEVAKNWSPSRSLNSFFSWEGTITKATGESTERFKEILEELNRTANMVSNAADGQEEINFSVKFTSGDKNKDGIHKNTMTVSPDLILTESGKIKNGGNYFDAMDALNGRVLLGSFIRQNIGTTEFNQFSTSTDDVAKRAFQVVQEFHAAKTVAKDWKGFIPYLEQHREMTHMPREQVETLVPNELHIKQLPNFLAIANYNLINSDNPIEIIDSEIKDVIDTFNSMIGDNFNSCIDAANYLRSKLKQDEQKQNDKESPGSGIGKGSSSSNPKMFDIFDKDVLADENIETRKSGLSEMSSTEEKDICDGTKFFTKVETLEDTRRNCEHQAGQAQVNYNTFVQKNRRCIKEIERCFMFQDTENTLHTRGLTAGDLDEGNLWRVKFDREHLYERQDTAKAPEHLVGILIDQSGSMGSRRMDEAKSVVITLLEGLKSCKAIKTMVYGHTAQEENQHECTMIEYKTDLVDNSHLLGGAPSRCQNLDGVAINFMGQAMDKVHVSGKKFLIIISDGSPSGYFYGGSSSQKHTFKACKTARSKGIKVFGIGICNAFSPAIGNALYGNGNFVVIDNTLDSLKIMTNQLKKFTASI